ncbi:MAG: PHP domain-containing protein [Firmicutes bacterium]|nr:PHP domain-containing protein [Bacillota bacterium]
MTGFDTHVHSDASDGQCSPARLVEKARDLGLLGIAITDHDTMAGIEEAQKRAGELDYPFIAGVELSAQHGEHEVHILGYWLDHRQLDGHPRMIEMRESRLTRCQEIVDRLNRLGFKLDVTDVIDAANGKAQSLGRPHVAKAMVKKGYADSMKEVFAKWLSCGAPAYVPRMKLDPLEAVEIIRSAGGVAVLAHPGVGGGDYLIPCLIRAGLGGIEVYHREHNRMAERKYLQIARAHGLAALGGSDFHAPGFRELGCRVTTLGQLALLAQHKE